MEQLPPVRQPIALPAARQPIAALPRATRRPYTRPETIVAPDAEEAYYGIVDTMNSLGMSPQ